MLCYMYRECDGAEQATVGDCTEPGLLQAKDLPYAACVWFCLCVSSPASNISAVHAELEVLADGLHMLLIDPYNEPQLKVRYPGTAEYKEVRLSCPC